MSDHEHDHPHAPITNGDEPEAAARVRALEELLVEKGVIRREDVREGIDWLVSRTPADGARLIARAWIDGRLAIKTVLLQGSSGLVTFAATYVLFLAVFPVSAAAAARGAALAVAAAAPAASMQRRSRRASLGLRRSFMALASCRAMFLTSSAGVPSRARL